MREKLTERKKNEMTKEEKEEKLIADQKRKKRTNMKGIRVKME